MLLTHVGWYGALLTLAVVGLLMAPLAATMVEKHERHQHAFRQSASEAMREALGHRGYVLLTLGFFVCGFQVVFVGVHLPSYLLDKGMPASLGVTALALIGLFNIIGTYTTGWLGAKVPKRYILSFIYFGRAVVIALFIGLPLSAWSVYAFAVALGLLWLSTVPPTNGIVGQVFGVRYMAMLTGMTFFSHQIGSFLGAWLGGYLFDRLGSYDLVWYLSLRWAWSPACSTCPSTSARSSGQPSPQRRCGRSRCKSVYAGRTRSMASVMIASTPQAASWATRCGSFTV